MSYNLQQKDLVNNGVEITGRPHTREEINHIMATQCTGSITLPVTDSCREAIKKWNDLPNDQKKIINKINQD